MPHEANGCQIKSGPAITHRSAPDLGVRACQIEDTHTAKVMPSAVTEPSAHNHCLEAARKRGFYLDNTSRTA